MEEGCGESNGVEGSSGDGDDSEESETTGMIFFLLTGLAFSSVPG